MSVKTFKSRHGSGLHTIEEDDKTVYGNGEIFLNNDNDKHLNPIGDPNYIVRTARNGGSTTSASKEYHKPLKRDDLQSVMTFKSYLTGGGKKSKNTVAKCLLLKYTNQTTIMAVAKQSP